jgi:hypothetical protein
LSGTYPNPTLAVAPVFTVVEEQIAGAGGVAAFDFTGIAQTYRHLQIWSVGQSENAAAKLVFLRFNNDSGANYSYEQAGANGTTPLGAVTTGATSAAVGTLTGTGMNYPGRFVIDVPYYAETVFRKECQTHGSWRDDATNTVNELFAVWWNNTAAVTRITLTADVSDWKVGSRAILYGIT